MATGGALLVYAGIIDKNPLEALRDVASGGPTPVRNAPSPSTTSSGTASPSSWTTVPGAGGGLAGLPQALTAFAADRYSQARRWQTGYSDCSSFIGKGLKRIGITPPGASTTWDYLRWKQLTRIPLSSAAAGDLVISTSHMVCVIGPGTAVGQQNPRSNVRTGSITDLMTGSMSYAAFRYSGGGGGGLAT